jgi:hypothetical protein
MNAARPTVSIRGEGVATATATRLLACDGFAVVGEAEGERPAAPAVLLSEAALALLRDVFARPGLFDGRTSITRRIVRWGGAAATVLPHGGIVVSGVDLAAELASPPLTAAESAPFFTLHGAPLQTGVLRQFGHREAVAAAVELVASADAQACHVEATESGWLFLIPYGEGKAWLLGVGDTLDALLGDSRLVAAQVDTLGPVAGRFETAPRMLERLAGDDWIACGTAAIAFDPICGDGTAQAVREAILATAVIAGIREGRTDRAALLGHYHAMLLAAMRRHLQICLPFYRSGGSTNWWREQAAAVADGYAWCTARLGTMPEPRFQLLGTRLVARALVA